MDRTHQEFVELVRAMLSRQDSEALADLLSPMHPADIADVLEDLDGEEQATLLKAMPNEQAAEVLTEVDDHSGQTLLRLLSDHEVVSLLGEMPSDDAADLLSSMTPEQTERVGALLPSANRDQLQELMGFDEESAGGIMEIEFIAVRDTVTVDDAINRVRFSAEEIENIQKVYVISARGELLGQVRVLDLIVHPRSAAIADIMQPNVVVIPVDMDQEQVAGLFGKYDEFTLPVVDDENRLVGRITVDDIIDVIEEEASEDIARIAGTTEEALGEPSVFKVSRSRLPWLVMGLLGQVATAFIMSRYEATLRTKVALAFFVPLIVGTAGAIGMQAAVVVVRELALGQIDLLRLGGRVFKEMRVAAVNAMILVVVLSSVAIFWFGDGRMAILLSTSLFAVIMFAAIIGSSVPLLFQRLKIDPAIATGPLIAVVNDIIGLTIYLTLATLYLSRLA